MQIVNGYDTVHHEASRKEHDRKDKEEDNSIKKRNLRGVKRITSCMLVAAMAGTMTGCGSGSSTDVAQTTVADEGPVQMEWLTSQTTAEVDDNAEVVKMIEERFNIDLKGFYVDPKDTWRAPLSGLILCNHILTALSLFEKTPTI